ARMHAVVDDSCVSLNGTFSARATQRRRFAAPRSTCGDGRLDLDGGEQCETMTDCADGQACDACVCGTGSASGSTARRKRTTTTTTSTTSSSSTRAPTTTTSSSATSSSSTATTSSSSSTSTTKPTTTSTSTATTSSST